MTTTLKPTTRNIGTNDVPGSWGKHYYKTWENMFNRCYSEMYHLSKPSYTECTVDPRWHHLSAFKEWYELQGDITGKHLDKDIISPNNKIYGPDTCFFVSRELNLFFTTSNRRRGAYPLGVCDVKGRKNVYRCTLKINGKSKTYGYYHSVEEAHQAYLEAKSSVLYEKYILPETNERLKNALMNVYDNMEEYFK
jgi:hypothetical protein